MKDCTGKEITEEWLYHLGVPVEDIEDLAEHSAVCVPTMMPYITFHPAAQPLIKGVGIFESSLCQLLNVIQHKVI